MKRKFLFIALALALPLALIVPLRALRSWQPRTLKLPGAKLFAGQRSNSELFWRPNGLLLVRADAKVWTGALAFNNWNGARVKARSVRAERASLDRQGTTAALVAFGSTARQHDLWDVEAGRTRGIIARLSGAESARHQFAGAYNWAISPDGQRLAWDNGSWTGSKQVVRLGQTATARTDATFDIYSQPTNAYGMNALAFAPDGRELAVVGRSSEKISPGSWTREPAS